MGRVCDFAKIVKQETTYYLRPKCSSFLHRSWSEPYDNDLAIYSDRIEICNPGHFTEEATPDDYIFSEKPSRPRNPLIAQIVFLSGEVEKWGAGIRKIYNQCKEENIKVKFEDRKTAFFVVVYRKDLQGLVGNTEKDLTNVPVNVPAALNSTEIKVFNIIKSIPNITQKELAQKIGLTEKTIKRTMQKLKEKKL